MMENRLLQKQAQETLLTSLFSSHFNIYRHMENSAISSDAKMADSPEESSWTFYIQGFNDDDQISSFSSEYESPSLVSGAASSAVKKFTNNCTEGTCFSSGKSSNRNICKQHSFKKQKIQVLAMDYDLEDTASSPVNSPKISYTNQFMNQREKCKMDVSEEKINIFAKDGLFTVERDMYYRDLKKRTCH